MRRTPADLIAELLAPAGTEVAQRAEEHRRLLERARQREHVEGWLEALGQQVPDDTPAELREYFSFALLGVCVGFSDRELSPFVEVHQAIVPPLLADIRAVYDQVKASGADYDREAFRFRAYDYGIHKAYYLDWDLYGSHEMY